MYGLLVVLFMLGAVQAKHVEVLGDNNEQLETVHSSNSNLTLNVLDFGAVDFFAKESGIARVNGGTAGCSCVKNEWEAFMKARLLYFSRLSAVLNQQKGFACNNAEYNNIINDEVKCIRNFQNALKKIYHVVGQYECSKVAEIYEKTRFSTSPCKNFRDRLNDATNKALTEDAKLQEYLSNWSDCRQNLKTAWETCNPSSNPLKFQFQNETAVTPGVN